MDQFGVHVLVLFIEHIGGHCDAPRAATHRVTTKIEEGGTYAA